MSDIVEQRLSLITLGVADLPRAIAFYEAIGWRRRLRAAEGVAFFQLGPLGLSLFPTTDLAADAGVAAGATAAGDGFRGMSLGQNQHDREHVDVVMAAMVAAGGRVMIAAAEKEWGGYGGYVADPDGHAWEIAWNPGFPLAEDGAIAIPE